MLARFALALGCLVGASLSAAAATADGILAGYALTSWNDGAGRALGSVYAVAQSDDGYLWLGADAGLLRFDGWRFVPWDTLGEAPVPGTVRTLAPARGGGLWAGLANPAAVARVRGGTLVHYAAGLDGLDAVTALVEDATGGLWAIADWTLFRWRANRWQPVALPWKARAGQVRHVFADRDGTVWIGTRWGVFHHQPDTDSFRLVSGEHVWGFAQSPSGEIWTSDVAAGFRRLGAAAAPRHAFEAAGYRLLFDRDGTLWVGTFDAGLWHVRRDGEAVAIDRAAIRSGLSSDSVLAISEDRDGSIWVGTTAGLHRLTARPLTPLDEVGFVLTVYPSASGGVLAGTTRGLVQIARTPDGWRPTRLGSAEPEVRALHRDPRGTLWLGTGDGLWRLDGSRLMHESLGDRSDMLVLTIAPAPDGALWLGDGQWLYRRDGTALHALQLPRESGLTTISFARYDRRGRLWLASPRAAGVLEPGGRFRRLDARDAPPARTLYDVLDAADGAVWLGTSRGLVHVRDDRMTVLGPEQGLPGDRIYAVVEDLHRDLWLSVDRGIVQIPRQEVERVLGDRAQRLQYRLFEPGDGVAGAPLGLINAARGPAGRLWFVRGGGVTTLDPGRLPKRTPAPDIRIEEAVANERRLAHGEATLPAGTRRLQVSFTVLTLAGSNRVRFRYRLDGFDTDWVDAGPRRTAYYTNLSPRDYRFRVEAHAEDGTWSTSAADWAFTIRPAFYQTGWFYGTWVLAAIGLTVLAWQLRLRWVKKQFALALAERARLSREIHDTLLQSLVGVALQMEGIAGALGPASVGAREQLTRVRRQVEAYIREARQSIWDLRSPILETHDLVPALRDFAREHAGDRPLRLSASVTGSDTPRPPNVDNQLLRIGQEAITNAVRHAGASRLQIELACAPDTVSLRVTDDGRGFDTASATSSGHYGLLTMRERAEELGGTLTVTSAAGRGTTVDATVPLTAKGRARLTAAV